MNDFRRIVFTFVVLLVGSVGSPADTDVHSLESRVALGIELLLVDADGIRLLRSHEVDVDAGGAHHQTLQLGREGGKSLVFRLAYEPVRADTIELELERSLHEDGARQELQGTRETISVLQAWSYTVLEETGLGGKLELRVVPFVREAFDDEPLEGSSFMMYLGGGPLIRFGNRVSDDEVVLRAINTSGTTGLRIGIPGTGIVKLSHRQFVGSAPCGWVRGHRLGFRVGSEQFGAWSNVGILPEDPGRPGKGWTLYCELLDDPAIHSAWWGPLGETAVSTRDEIVEARSIDLNWAMELNRNGRWAEAAELADRLLEKQASMTPLQACEARYHAIYGLTRLRRLDEARERIAVFDRQCKDRIALHWLNSEVAKLRTEL